MNDGYRVFYIKTKNKYRKIVSYYSDNFSLRKKHEFIADKLTNNFRPSIFAHGYTKEHSIYTNCLLHINNNYFFKFDIKDFFRSINHKKLTKLLYNEIKYIASPMDCYSIVKMCSIDKVGLPLGFVTSPILANIYLKSFDIKLYKKLKEVGVNNIIYTRYADDMVISFKNALNGVDVDNIIKEIKNIVNLELKKYCLKINNKKTQFISFDKNNHVRITGISIVNKDGVRKLSIGRNEKRKFFYEVVNYFDSKDYSELQTQKLKGKMSFYLSVEKVGFDDFLSDGMKRELVKRGANSIIDLINIIT